MKNIFCSIIALIAFTASCLAQKDLINLAYGKHPQQTVDLFLPKHYSGSTPVVIMIHGGAWMMGGKEYTDKRAKDLRDRGFVVANIDYRYVSETVHCNDLLEDVDNAVAYVQKEGRKHGYNTDQVNMAGISAGAHLSLLYGYTTKRKVNSITAICPPTKLDDGDIIQHLKNVKLDHVVELLADAKFKPDGRQDEKFTLVSPYYRIMRIPTLLIHGDNDHLVPYEQSSSLYMSLQERNVESRLLTMKGKDHDAGLNDADTEKEAYDNIVDWINLYN
ncbi:alpha/beta hydrolase [Flavobacterium sp. MFBS3-15]|uniref:alpha/beta hydrolase n=1 Tax=Flavobacterium sp. MFBS3-15 TaxID=2989816 RepID=UPI002235B4E7|nr:alpha/beta hydrolase [Flavobacterium sp. MFBS3-15]MCW4469894.1 alpha/beta hydrolase [Flavobacterium sp. MFBS3-15]